MSNAFFFFFLQLCKNTEIPVLPSLPSCLSTGYLQCPHHTHELCMASLCFCLSLSLLVRQKSRLNQGGGSHQSIQADMQHAPEVSHRIQVCMGPIIICCLFENKKLQACKSFTVLDEVSKMLSSEQFCFAHSSVLWGKLNKIWE